MTISRYLRYLWQAWVFVATFAVFPLGAVSWWTDPWFDRPWSYLVAALLTCFVMYCIWAYYTGRYRG